MTAFAEQQQAHNSFSAQSFNSADSQEDVSHCSSGANQSMSSQEEHLSLESPHMPFRQVDYLWLFDPYMHFSQKTDLRLEDSYLTGDQFVKMR